MTCTKKIHQGVIQIFAVKLTEVKIHESSLILGGSPPNLISSSTRHGAPQACAKYDKKKKKKKKKKKSSQGFSRYRGNEVKIAFSAQVH